MATKAPEATKSKVPLSKAQSKVVTAKPSLAKGPKKSVEPQEDAAPQFKTKEEMQEAYGNLLAYQGSDHWEEGLIPQSLVDEIYAAMESSESEGSSESFEHVTESGTVLRLRRKKKKLPTGESEEETEESEEEEYMGKKKRPSVPDVEGGIPKSMLKKMSIPKLQEALNKIYEEIEEVQCENYILERTMSKMEQREKEIEASLPAFTYQFPWEIEKKYDKVKKLQKDAVCMEHLPSDDDEAPLESGEAYKPLIPAQDIDLNSPEFDNMSMDTKLELRNYFELQAEIAPANFDVFRHKYGNLVKPTKRELAREAKTGPIYDDELPEALSEIAITTTGTGIGTGIKVETPSPSKIFMAEKPNLANTAAMVHVQEEDPEFPGFVPKLAKRLPVSEKLKYAQIEEEQCRKDFFMIETEGIEEENSVQVYIDTYQESFNISSKLTDLLKGVIISGRHPLTGKLRAEKLLRFRDRMRRRYLGELSKMKILLTECVKKKRKVDKQLTSNMELGESIQFIDYEQLRIENAEFQDNIQEQQETLYNLKLITATIYQQLKEHRERLQRHVNKCKQINDDIVVRGNLKNAFDTNSDKVSDHYAKVMDHNDFLTKRLRAFKSPSTMDYIGHKSIQHTLIHEVNNLKKKLEAQHLTLLTARSNYRNYRRLLPGAISIPKSDEEENEDQKWLGSIQKEFGEEEEGETESYGGGYDSRAETTRDSLTKFLEASRQQVSPVRRLSILPGQQPRTSKKAISQKKGFLSAKLIKSMLLVKKPESHAKELHDDEIFTDEGPKVNISKV